MSDEFENMTVAQLKDVLRERGLPVSGKKAELVARLMEESESPTVEDQSIVEEDDYVDEFDDEDDWGDEEADEHKKSVKRKAVKRKTVKRKKND